MGSVRSTADARRPVVIAQAIDRFADGGWGGTTIADVASSAEISTAYVLKLYPTKEALFLAAFDACIDRIVATISDAATGATSPADALDRMGGAYAHLIANRSVLMMQVHAQSAASVPAIGAALRAGLGRVIDTVSSRSGADAAAVQRFMAWGQLCHLIVTAGVEQVDADWARVLAAGIRHEEADPIPTA